MSSSTEYNFMRQKFKAMTLFEFLDKYPFPTNLKEVEEQISGRTFRFLHSLNPDTLQTKVSDSLDFANKFWNLPDIKAQHTKFIDEWGYDRNFNNWYCFGFVNCLIELMWIRERMLAAKKHECNKANHILEQNQPKIRISFEMVIWLGKRKSHLFFETLFGGQFVKQWVRKCYVYPGQLNGVGIQNMALHM